MVASYSNKFVVIADYRKASSKLGQAWDYVPIEVLALAYRPLMARIEEQLGGHCEVNEIWSMRIGIALFQVRMAKAKAGPVVTDNGGMIVDWYDNLYFTGALSSSTPFSHNQVLGQKVTKKLA